MSKVAEHHPKWNKGESWTTPAAIESRWKGADPHREQLHDAFKAAERAQKWATFTKVLSRAKSDLFEIELAAGWLDSVGRPLPPEDLAEIKSTARVLQRLLGSVS